MTDQTHIPYSAIVFTENMESEAKNILSFRAATDTIHPMDAFMMDQEWTDRMLMRLSNSPVNYISKHVNLPKTERGVCLGIVATTVDYAEFRKTVEAYCAKRNLPLPFGLDACARADVFATVEISRYTLCHDDNPVNQRLDPPLF